MVPCRHNHDQNILLPDHPPEMAVSFLQRSYRNGQRQLFSSRIPEMLFKLQNTDIHVTELNLIFPPGTSFTPMTQSIMTSIICLPVKMVHVKVWDIVVRKLTFTVDILNAREMARDKDPSGFDKGQMNIVSAGQSIAKACGGLTISHGEGYGATNGRLFP